MNKALGINPAAQYQQRMRRANEFYVPAAQSPPDVRRDWPAVRGGYAAGDPYASENSPRPNRPNRPVEAYGHVAPENSQDAEIFRDRHGYFMRGTERGGRISCQNDPLASGPPRADFRAVNVTWNLEAGTGQRNADDFSRPYTWLGQQDGSWVPVYGGSPGFYRHGPGGYPSRTTQDGPQRVYGGPPHGLHSDTMTSYVQTLSRYNTVPQMAATRVDRLSNSRIGGQSYSQTTQHQGQPNRRAGR
jgi:hypothetical protein